MRDDLTTDRRKAVNRMSAGLTALRLEVPAAVADDLTGRWLDVLAALDALDALDDEEPPG